MNLSALLEELETLTHDGRVRRMVERGRSGSDAVLEQLARGDWYERHLAVMAAFGYRREAVALAACRDSSRGLHRQGRKLIALVGGDDAVVEAIRTVPPRQIAGYLSFLRGRRRVAAIDRFLAAEVTRQPRRVALLLPFGSAAMVQQHVQLGEEMGGLLWWVRMARQHPQLAAERWSAQASRATPPDLHLMRVAERILPVLGSRAPDVAVRMLAAVGEQGKPSVVALEPLLCRRANEVVRWLLALVDPPMLTLSRVAHRLEPGILLEALARMPQHFGEPERVLGGLAAPLRQRAFAVGTGWRVADGSIPPALLRLLPQEVREPEARRQLGLPALADQPARRAQYAGCLPWGEALPLVEPLLKHPEGDMRAAGLQALVGVGRYDRERLADILAALRRRANEQDPVRLAFAQALADLPPSRWQDEHLADIEQIIQDGLNARDLSWGTTAQFQRLLARLVPFRPGWALRTFVGVMGNRGSPALGSLESQWSDEHVRHLEPLLRDLVKDWLARKGDYRVLTLITALGRRVRVLPFLLDVLERLVRTPDPQAPSVQALHILKTHVPKRFAALVLELLRADESWITNSLVWSFLHRHRQDLLTPFLPPRAYGGRFTTRGSLFVLPVTTGCHRWTAAQQHLFARSLDRILQNDLRLDAPRQVGLLRQLAALPGVAATAVVQFAGHERPVVRDVAIGVLGRLDDMGQVVPPLVECLYDDRARVAIYALRRAVLQMQPDAAVALLRTAPLERVTVAKEVFRLLGELPGEGAFALLREAAGRKLHRDIRIALLRALWDHLERDEAWPLLEQAAAEVEFGPASSLIRIPDDRLSQRARGRLVELMMRLLEHPEPGIRVALLRRLAELPLRDPQRRLLSPVCARLAAVVPNERVSAANALVAGIMPADAGRVAEGIAEVARNRRALVAALTALYHGVRTSPARLASVVAAVVEALADDAVTATWRARLSVHCFPRERWFRWWGENAPTLHADALAALAAEVQGLAGTVFPTSALEELLTALVAAEDERLRRLAVALLLALAERRQGWDRGRLELLARLRRDSSVLVAAAAEFVLPEEEVHGILA